MALSRSPYLRQVTSFILSCNDIGNAGMDSLAASLNFSLLTDLDLGSNHIESLGVTALASSPFATRLLSLDLSDNLIGDDGVEALAASATFGGAGYARPRPQPNGISGRPGTGELPAPRPAQISGPTR
jgi:hypothetical protein